MSPDCLSVRVEIRRCRGLHDQPQRGGMLDQYIKTETTAYPGFSGGPLLAADGAFAGINSSALLHGISVALPAPTIARVVDTLLTHGRVPRGYLGIGIQPVRLGGGLQERAGQETGLMVMSDRE